MALSFRKKFLLGAVLLLLVAGLAGGALVYFLAQGVPAHWQEPNKVELLEANRKLKLLDDALAEKQKGFIRLSEVEIDSFLEDRFSGGTNSPASSTPGLNRAVVLLDTTNLTLITWVRLPIKGLKTPLVWQRDLVPVTETNGWKMALAGMRLGALEVPRRLWPRVEAELGSSDGPFEERSAWFRQLPFVAIMRNDQSRSLELRLYSYIPEPATPPR